VAEDSRIKKKVSGPEIPEAVYKNFEKLFSDQYRYFDYPSMLRKLKIPMQLWTEGMNLAKSGQFELESVDIRFFRRMGGVQSGVATGILHKKRRDISVFVWFTQDTVTEMSCYDDDCMLSYFDSSDHGNNQICVHMAALIYLMGSYLYDHNPGDATDSGASRLVDNFRKDYLQSYSRQERTAAESQLISTQPLLDLEPYVMLKNGTLQMMMRVGAGRKYKIKDLQEFCTSVEQHQSMRFGSKTEFLLGDDRFTSRGLEYYRFLHRIIRQHNAADENGADFSDLSASVLLYGSILDDFYDILKGDSVEYKVYGGEK
jgi:hypothetical protein